jgi:hypothetical protein
MTLGRDQMFGECPKRGHFVCVVFDNRSLPEQHDRAVIHRVVKCRAGQHQTGLPVVAALLHRNGRELRSVTGRGRKTSEDPRRTR